MSSLSIEAVAALALNRADGQSGARRWRERLAGASESFWREVYRELRRHAGDERLPFDLRRRLRSAAQRSLDRSVAAGRCAVSGSVPRQGLRDRPPFRLPGVVEAEARRVLATAGVDIDAPFVALEVKGRVDVFRDAIDYLASAGLAVVRIGNPAAGRLRHPAVIDLASVGHPASADLHVLAAARFVVCESTECQYASYLTATPSLRLNAIDVFSSYPIRGDALFTVSAAVDLDTGRLLDLGDLLSEGYARARRNYGHRSNTAEEVAAAVREIDRSLRDGWRETEAQTRFRASVIDAAADLAARVRDVAIWGPDDGFIGEGRLAQVQAERA